MKRPFFKPILAILTFFIGVGVVSLWYLSRDRSVSQQPSSNTVSSATPVPKPTFDNPCDYPQPQNRKLEAEEVVHLAECFIIQNGYTDLPPITDESKLTPENVYPGTDEEGLKMRHDSLERKAYSYIHGERYGDGWIVMFRYKPHPDVLKFYGDRLNHIGRAVTMDAHGKRLRLEHSDYPLRMPESRIISP
jgi:hypothetical protein